MPVLGAMEYIAGSTIRLRFTWTDDAGAVANLIGASFAVYVARPRATISVLSTEDSPATIDVDLSQASVGVLDAVISEDDSEGLRGTYLCEGVLTDVSNDVSKHQEYFTVKKSYEQ